MPRLAILCLASLSTTGCLGQTILWKTCLRDLRACYVAYDSLAMGLKITKGSPSSFNRWMREIAELGASYATVRQSKGNKMLYDLATSHLQLGGQDIELNLRVTSSGFFVSLGCYF